MLEGKISYKKIASITWLLSQYSLFVPEEYYNFLVSTDDSYSLAEQGILDIEEVEADINTFLSNFKKNNINSLLIYWTVRSFPENQFSLRAETLAGTDLHNM